MGEGFLTLLSPFAIVEVASFSCLVKIRVSPSRVAVLRGPPGRWAVGVLTWGWSRRVDSSWCLWGEPCAPVDLWSPTSPLHIAPSPITWSCRPCLVPEATSRQNITVGKLGLGEKNNPVERLPKRTPPYFPQWTLCSGCIKFCLNCVAERRDEEERVHYLLSRRAA